ncbi:MAG: hypothetical protein E7183_08005 [Erysipelotrichaceae bacterium]|nr:hypothetical protein [Erysipelotrichaceae bacterium]
MNKENKIAIIGLSGESIFMKMDHFNEEGETVVANTYHVEYGGKGYNQAVAAARYGAKVSFLTLCGDDNIATLVENTLKKENINAHVIRRTNKKSASACIMIDKQGKNRVVCYPGVSIEMTKEDVMLFEEEIKISKYLLLQLEMSDESLYKAIELAKKHNTLVILNPAPAKKLPINLLKDVYLITPNEHEAKMLFDLVDENNIKNIDLNNVIITLGEKGSILKEKDLIYKIPAKTVIPVNTTGAGDTYNGVLVAALLEGKSLYDAAIIASVASSISVTKEFVIDSIPYKEEIK